MDGAANSPSRCKTMVAPSPFPRPLSEGWWRRHLIPRPCPLAAGTISVPFPSQFGCRRISLELVRHLRELPGLVRHLCGLTICYPRTLLLPRSTLHSICLILLIAMINPACLLVLIPYSLFNSSGEGISRHNLEAKKKGSAG
ncbi:Os12g0457500 [Oryza sativa Japonica Group]|uniref:Os12g0457500 protein n=2 Tax=Oryza sativa subsp. japonica TaxID=39947 RepID=B9GD15_ORYSJ|nr:expressed protein [Oryza sativa Japonica Group]EEE53172.1 hypothetical protein OsJ_36012 [Oryza sativa Japonica Group]BAF29751.1 Os12g0457500 [Oryza sativa Japonica Group]BAG93346.1 unnamed protein product [Oryza sativa Japonica Group]BAT17044.1 Os12g0457500 [Oryza sativa Japonica Group]|eukprot:NP_001066732.1 Os12g0457500 [Oryza sativa Japonica Group]